MRVDGERKVGRRASRGPIIEREEKQDGKVAPSVPVHEAPLHAAWLLTWWMGCGAREHIDVLSSRHIATQHTSSFERHTTHSPASHQAGTDIISLTRTAYISSSLIPYTASEAFERILQEWGRFRWDKTDGKDV